MIEKNVKEENSVQFKKFQKQAIAHMSRKNTIVIEFKNDVTY